MKIYNDYNPWICQWVCTDENYDGAPDAGPQIVGEGNTKEEAFANYERQIQEAETNEGNKNA